MDAVSIPLMSRGVKVGETIIDAIDAHWVGQRSWHLTPSGYVGIYLFGGRNPSGPKVVLLHRLILLAPDSATVDHVNRNTVDNRRINLRLATMTEQNANKVKTYGESRFKGVHRRWDARKWVAQIKGNGKHIHLGSFEAEEDAARAYDRAAVEMFGDFSRLNFPEDYGRTASAILPRSQVRVRTKPRAWRGGKAA